MENNYFEQYYKKEIEKIDLEIDFINEYMRVNNLYIKFAETFKKRIETLIKKREEIILQNNLDFLDF